jgi:hypothetical protein
MNWRIKDRISDSEFVGVCQQSKSMAEAAATLGLHFNSFKKRALELRCYQTNQSGIGFPKSFKEKVPLQEILQGLHPYFQTYKLKIRLLKSEVLCHSQTDTYRAKNKSRKI